MSTNIYNTITLANHTDRDVPMIASINNNVPILKNPDQYNCVVQSFYFPNANTPYFTWHDTDYLLKLVYGSNSVQRFITCTNMSLPPNPSKDIYDIRTVINNINDCFMGLIADYVAAYGATLPVSDAPYVSYDVNTDKIVIHFNVLGYSTRLANPIYIQFNAACFKFFQGLPVYGLANSQSTIDVYPQYAFRITPDAHNRDVVDNILSLTADSALFANLTDFAEIVIKSDLKISNYVVSEGSTIDPVLFSFIPTGITQSNFGEPITYTCVYPYRTVSISSQQPLYGYSLQIYRRNKVGDLFLMSLLPEDRMEINLIFMPK